MAILRIKDKNGNWINVPAIKGQSAYEIAKEKGFEGTEEEWLESLKGKPYELTEGDKNEIRDEVIDIVRPEHNILDNRVNLLEVDSADTENRLNILEKAVANYSKLQIEKVSSIDEMIKDDVIYLLPSNDGTYYDEYLVYENIPERIGSTEIDLTNYVTKDFLQNNTKHYRHNIIFWYRHSNKDLNSSGSDGNFQATFTLINDDPVPYAFSHNLNGETTATMSADNAWQLLRFYRALQLSKNKNSNLARPCSGTSIIVAEASPYSLTRAINSSISTGYVDYKDADWKRYIKVHSSLIDTGSLGGRSIEIGCGHPTFVNNEETSLWATKEEFIANEYNLKDSFGKQFSTYFSRHRLYCTDNVEEVPLIAE